MIALAAVILLSQDIGSEVSVARHLKDDEEFTLGLQRLLQHGHLLFAANWTVQEGGGRPLSKGTGRALSDPSTPLIGERAFNRISAPDANSCAGCHNQPYGITGGGGDFVTNVFVLGQRFDFVTFDPADKIPTRGAVDENQGALTLQTLANSRSTTGMFGAGYLELLTREMTRDLQAIRATIQPGDSAELVAKGVSFGKLSRTKDGLWITSGVTGLGRASLSTHAPLDPPSLVIRPWHQAGNVVSLREFTNNAFHHHHGIQATERFGLDKDDDGDGFVNELTRADVTAVTMYQAAMAVPGRVIPNQRIVELAVYNGERVFMETGCATCHIPSLPLDSHEYVEPSPYNPPLNLRAGETQSVRFLLSDPTLPAPRLSNGARVPAFTDFKLHDLGEQDEALDMNQTNWTERFHQGNRRFLTKRLWGAANESPFFHHGRFTTLRQAVHSHHGEAQSSLDRFMKVSKYDRDSLIEFLKTLQVLPPGTRSLIVDENFQPKAWPPNGYPSPLEPSGQ